MYAQALVGAIPSIPTGMDYEDPNLTTISELLAAGDTVHFYQQLWPNARIQDAMFSGVQGMFAAPPRSSL